MLEFKKYNSIENTYNKEFMDKIKTEGFDSLQYVVQEKVHGANCSFITDGQTVQFAKRTGLVEAGEKFYNYEELLEKYKERVIGLYHLIKEKYTDTESVSIYGEMFGGKYPHPDIMNDTRIMCIQKGVFYSPNHEFYGFDLYVCGTENNRYLPVNEMNRFFEEGGFFYAKTLLEGSLDECLLYPNAFQSRIAEWMGLPPIEENICEGVVIRPEETVFFRNGSRLLLKNKNSKFSEKKSIKKRQSALFVEPTYSEELNNLLVVAEEYITENRLNNVISKIGEISVPKDLGRLIGLLSKDALEDFEKEHSSDYAFLEKSEQKILNRHINKQATEIIKKVYMV
ncbi:RNA ligase, Rnl2 family [Dysgonomonas sp. 520]|uniref:RNA ligase, Rnl2 family n=1 Tax=Dysgonomonas sp. 520 TaxID=2302931 RepID=UPI0013D72396|nr:RNA ligase, Rnl2 family [Dysgonomonas sp. 520]NDW08875.1 RNA ligase, Rnl2 family [Dysgonomonas sp. 520]